MFQKLQTMFYEILRLFWGAFLLWCMKILYWTLAWCMGQFEDLWKRIIIESEKLIAMFVAAMPSVGCGFGTASHWIGVANSWLPISESVGLLLAYWAFVAAFCAAKYVWKAIPATG